jgi:ATP-binding cassette subfamily F protein 3
MVAPWGTKMLRIQNITYRIAGRAILEEASATIPGGHHVGLVGLNGSGKTTLLKLITGELAADEGEILMPRQSRIGAIAQEAPDGDASLLETVLQADQERTRLLDHSNTETDPTLIAEIHARLEDIEAHSAPARAATILAGLGFRNEQQQRPCREFSGGWRMRVALASLLFSKPEILLLDEPTNYLDLEGSMWLESFLRNYPQTMILVSHDRHFLNNTVGEIWHLNQRRLAHYKGGYDDFERIRAAKQELEGKLRTKRLAQRKHMQAFVDRFRYKASKAKQAQSRLKALEKLEPFAAIASDRVAPFDFPTPSPLSPPMIEMESASVGYEPNRPILSNLNLRIDMQDRIALLGANGNGKSTFAKLLAGRLDAQSGAIERDRKMMVGYFAQHQSDELDAADTPVEQLGRFLPKAIEGQIRNKLGSLGFSRDKADTKIGQLSGGEKARLLLGLATLHAPHLLILDEPTNHLDIDSREALVHAINSYDGAILLISHDARLIETCVDQLWLVENGEIQTFDGDLDLYREKVMADINKPSGPVTQKTSKRQESKSEKRKRAAAQRASISHLKKTVQNAQKQLDQIQKAQAEVEHALSDQDLYDGGQTGEIESLMRRRTELTIELEAAEQNWLEAHEAYEHSSEGS